MFSNSSENGTAFYFISRWNSCCFSLISSHLCGFLPRLFFIALFCRLSVHIRQWSLFPTSAAHTCSAVSLRVLLPFSTTIKSRMELSRLCLHCLVHSGPAFFYSTVERLHLVVFKEHQHRCLILIICYFPIVSNVLIRVACFPISWIKISH